MYRSYQRVCVCVCARYVQLSEEDDKSRLAKLTRHQIECPTVGKIDVFVQVSTARCSADLPIYRAAVKPCSSYQCSAVVESV